MFKPKTFDEICRAMQTRSVIQIDSYCGLVNGIEPEDGSGRSWNVKIQPVNERNIATDVFGYSLPSVTVYFRE